MTQNSQPLPIALLVIDDRDKSLIIHKSLKIFFSLFETQESFSAAEWMKHFQASLIIIDENALNKTWPLFVQHIRKLPGYGRIPIFLISHTLRKTFIDHALSCGITDFLLDPLDSNEIYQRVLVHMKSAPVAKRISLLTKRMTSSSKPDLLLPERFFVTEEVIKRVSLSRSNQSPLALVLIEIDRFKDIQEQYKTDVTMQLIETLMALFKTHLRKNDFLIPQSSARFLLILPHTSQRAAVAISEMIRKEVELASFQVKNTPISLTLSMGLITFDTSPARNIYDQFELLLEKVDRALSEAKRKGNQLITYTKRIL